MREMQIIFPTHDNDGQSLKDVHRKLRDRLCTEFGRGFHASLILGGWPNPVTGEIFEEEGFKYIMAVHCADADSKLRQLAQWVGKEGHQEAVYVCYCDGTVEIINILQSGQNAA